MASSTEDESHLIVDINDSMKTDAMGQVKQYKKFKIKAKYALENLKIESKVSEHLKKFFDNKYGPCWHCIVAMKAKISYFFMKDK